MHFYGLGFVIAGIFGVFFLLAIVTGEVPGQRRGSVRRDERPQMYWANVGFMLVAGLIAGALGLFGWISARG